MTIMESGVVSPKVSVKNFLETPCALELLCFMSQYAGARLALGRMASLSGRWDGDVLESLRLLESLGLASVRWEGGSAEAEFKGHAGCAAKREMDDFIWTHQDEYGRIYKKVLTAQVREFLRSRR